MENPPAHFPAWPGDAEVAVALTFDVDGEAPWLSEGPGYAGWPTTQPQGRSGPGPGAWIRILGLLAELEVPATPPTRRPATPLTSIPPPVGRPSWPAVMRVSATTYLHRGTDGLDPAAQRRRA